MRLYVKGGIIIEATTVEQVLNPPGVDYEGEFQGKPSQGFIPWTSLALVEYGEDEELPAQDGVGGSE